MIHVSEPTVNRQISRFIKTENKRFDLAKIIKMIMQQSFSNISLAKLDKQAVLYGYESAVINEVSKAAIYELFNREPNEFDEIMISQAWKLVYKNGLAMLNQKLMH